MTAGEGAGSPPATGAGRPLAVFDVDGVLADVAHRVHHLDGPRKDWSAFFAAAADDPPLPPGLALASELAADHDLAYLTGRPERLRRVTRRWLGAQGLPAGPLWMRPSGDFRPARAMKLEALRRLAVDRPVEIVVDDDEQVVTALRDAGFAVLLATWAGPSARARRTLHRAQERDGRT